MPGAAGLAVLAGAESTAVQFGWAARLSSFIFAESPLSCCLAFGSWLTARLGWQDLAQYSLLRLVDSSSHVDDAEKIIVLVLYVLLTVMLLVVLWSLVFDLRSPDVLDPKANLLSAPVGWFQEARAVQPPPPRLCPTLSPHNQGAQFQVGMDALQLLRQGISPAQVAGPAHAPQLHAWLVRDDGGHFGARGVSRGGRSGLWLELTTSPTRRDVHASIGPLEDSGQEPVEICGPGGLRYGQLESSRWGCHVVRNGVTVQTISSSGPFPNLKVSASCGSTAAAAAPSVAGAANGVQALVVHTFPGADAPLALLCILAAVAMSPELPKACAAPASRTVSQALSPAGTGTAPVSPSSGPHGVGSVASTPASRPQR
mmetsp:Transcript_28670/g.75036  ORF Transcript_28670/g.75036 Transcript_28670/m.75036 type:complete len:371 (+) Transcript_28670:180-1292(+)